MISLNKNGLLLIVVLMCLTASVHCGCVDRSDPNYETAKQTDGSSISDFLTNIGCSIQSGAKRVKDGVEGGYKYLKDKITTAGDETSARDREHRPSEPNADAVIEGQGEIYKHIRDSVPLVSKKPNVTLDDRNAIAAPIACPPNQKYEKATEKCEAIVNDFD